ncbi:MAG: DUF1553 domain-containing protein [Victivallaceae bacterium]|nr:DUF1553 domain-containing protein [Victivallaceae bacterium]
MKKHFSGLLLSGLLLSAVVPGCSPSWEEIEFQTAPNRVAVTAFEKNEAVRAGSAIDAVFARMWRRHDLPANYAASDEVLFRRVHLDLTGRLPGWEEAIRYAADKDPEKFRKCVEKLLMSPGFCEYWTMKFCDSFRVKSEFPINLWPNAVYNYQRRIYSFLEKGEPVDSFVRSLLVASGSNFRVAEVNFYRAAADRSAAGLAKNFAMTFLGENFAKYPSSKQKNLAEFFEGVRFKATREWKEEIVYAEALKEARTFTNPDGKRVTVPAGEDPRVFIADWLISSESKPLARGMSNFVLFHLLGHGAEPDPDDISGSDSPLLKYLSNFLVEKKYDLRALLRVLVNSAAYQASSLWPDESTLAEAERNFACYPVRRLEAEVLEDVLRDLTGTAEHYASVIPEPFSFIPDGNRAVMLADGSIGSPFLTLMGRSARDSGALGERNNLINAKQRLFLFNSGKLAQRLNAVNRDRVLWKSLDDRVHILYWRFLSRPPQKVELEAIGKAVNAFPTKERWRMVNDIVWLLANSGEFLYRH